MAVHLLTYALIMRNFQRRFASFCWNQSWI